MNKITVKIHGQEHTFKDEDLWGGDPQDPFSLLQAMERLPGTFAFYANILREGRSELSAATEGEDAARATLAHNISEREQKSTGKKPAAAEVERILSRESDHVLRALEATHGEAEFPGDEALANFARAVQNRREWTDIAQKLDVIVDTVRLRCSMVRSQAELLEACLQQNLIAPPRGRGAPDPKDRIGGPADDGRL